MRSRFALAAAALSTFAFASASFGDLLWDNGPLSTGTLSRSGVASPAGFEWSELALGNTVAGFSVHNTGTTGFRVADDFSLPVAANLSSLTAFVYTTGSAPTALYSVGNIRIWNGRPGDTGSTVVFGDTTTDRLVSSAATNLYRIFGTTAAPGGTASTPGTTRLIKTAVFDLENVFLDAGTYWADYQINPLTTGGTVFHPSVTLLNDRNRPTDNGRQFITTGVWQDLLDTGNPAALPDLNQDLAFQVEGVLIPEPVTGSILALAALGLARRRR